MNNIILLPTKSCILHIIFAIKYPAINQAPVRHERLMLTLKFQIVLYNPNDSA
jgi:hypothetical protein